MFKLLVTVFHLGIWYLGWEKLLPLENRDRLCWTFIFVRLKGLIFRFKYLLYNFGNYWDMHGMQPITLDYVFQILRWKWEHFISGPFNIFYRFSWDLWKRTGDYWYKHVVFFPTKMKGMIKKQFWALCGENTGPLYWIPPYLLSKDRSTAARSCACLKII